MKEDILYPLYKMPLKLEKNRVYRPFIGGKLLEEWQNDENPKDDHYGERWISSLTEARASSTNENEGLSIIISNNKTLKQVIQEKPIKFLGENHYKKYGNNLGVLVKALDSYSRLLIQVHPNKELAKKYFNSPFGKTEAWYILDTREVNGEQPYILLGFKEGVTKEELKEAFHKQDIKAMETMMHKFFVNQGDVFFIEAGLPHAIGSGCFLIEIQEPTDYTIRVEKTTPDGREVDDFSCHQGLGFEKMFECFNYTGFSKGNIEDRFKINPKVIWNSTDVKVENLISEKQTSLFQMQKLSIKSKLKLESMDSFAIFIILKGEGKLICNNLELELNKADEFFIPYDVYNLELINQGIEQLELIICFPPKS